MTDAWLGDAVSLVDALRAGELTPVEAVEASLAAVAASGLNTFSHLDADAARAVARHVDVHLPFGGVPVGIKELDKVEGWPDTEASLVFKDRRASTTSTYVERLRAAGAVPIGLTTASEFGGLNVSVSRLNGVTTNPWGHGRTAGGSSGGSAAAVAAGLVPIASGGDGGGSIRIPAAFCGLFGLKGTYGRIPRGPKAGIYPMTAVLGCLARSVRDTARWFDVTAGHDSRDPYSLLHDGSWEAGLGSIDLSGLRVAISPDLGSAVVRPEAADLLVETAEWLVNLAGWKIVDVPVKLPGLGLEWAMSNIAADLMKEMHGLWPDCKEDLTLEIAFGVEVAHQVFDLGMATKVEIERQRANETMAELFDDVDLVISLSNPDVAYPAEVTLNTRVGDRQVGPENNAVLTIPANLVGNASVSVPIGLVDGLPVGMQVMGRHHSEPLLLDVGLLIERERPWPLVAPGSPC